MSDLPPDAARLRVLRTYLALQLAEVDRAIVAAERQQAAPPVPPPAPRAAATAPRRTPAPPPAWGIARIGLGGPEAVHRGDCWAEGGEMRPLSREDAAAHLAAGTPGCDVCRPERVLLQRD